MILSEGYSRGSGSTVISGAGEDNVEGLQSRRNNDSSIAADFQISVGASERKPFVSTADFSMSQGSPLH